MEGSDVERKGRLVLKPVAWINKLEFETVYTKIYSDDPLDQRWAVDRVSAWAARGHAVVPVGVDVTEALVRAKIQDYTVQHNISVSNFPDVSLMYCMALIRFVNLIAEHCQHYEYSIPLRDLARKHGIPDWIIQLRHKATHSSVPSLEKLRSAAAVCLEWLDGCYWKPELENCHDFCQETDDTEEVACREALLDFQSSQCQSLFSPQKCDGRRCVKSAVLHISKLVKDSGKCLIKTLAKPEFLLSLTACSIPLLESSDMFIQEEAVSLPKNMEKFWQPVISAIHQKDLLGELVLCLIQSLTRLSEENQRMAMAWVWKIVYASSESWGLPTTNDSDISRALKHNTPLFNWFELLDACLRSCSKYLPAVLPILMEHVFPPLSANKKNCLTGLVCIATGALAGANPDTDMPKDQRVYTLDNIKTVLELQDVVDRGETSLYYTENPWKQCTDDINWSDYPLGYVFCLENDGVLGPKALETDEVSQVRNEKHATPSEAAVVDMKVQKVHESPEMPVAQESVDDIDINEDESYANGCNADYCNLQDVLCF